MYEKILKEAEKQAHSILYEAVFKSKGGDMGEREPPASNWILATGSWNDGGIWIANEKWKDN